MVTKIKNAIAILLIAGLGGLSGAYIFSNYISTPHPTANNVSERQPIQKVSFPNTVDGALTDFTKAADMTIHAVVHVKTVLVKIINSREVDPASSLRMTVLS
jgi:hypothetical protein